MDDEFPADADGLPVGLREAMNALHPNEDQISTLAAFYLWKAMQELEKLSYEDSRPGTIYAHYEGGMVEAQGFGNCDHVHHFVAAAAVSMTMLKHIQKMKQEDLGELIHVVLTTHVLWAEKPKTTGFWKKKTIPLRERFNNGDPDVTEELAMYIITRSGTAEVTIPYRHHIVDGWEVGEPELGWKSVEDTPDELRWGVEPWKK